MRGWVIIGASILLGLVAVVGSYATAPRFAPSASGIESTRYAPEVAPLGSGERRAYDEMRLGVGPGAQTFNGTGPGTSSGSVGSASGSGIVPARGGEPSPEQMRQAFDTLAPAAPTGR